MPAVLRLFSWTSLSCLLTHLAGVSGTLAMVLAASCIHPLHDQHQLTAGNENKHILMGDGLTATTLFSMHRDRTPPTSCSVCSCASC